MNVLDILRKGFGYLLMSMGVSSPEQKRPMVRPPDKTGAKPAAKPDPGGSSRS
jgi:hypothetical protein